MAKIHKFQIKSKKAAECFVQKLKNNSGNFSSEMPLMGINGGRVAVENEGFFRETGEVRDLADKFDTLIRVTAWVADVAPADGVMLPLRRRGKDHTKVRFAVASMGSFLDDRVEPRLGRTLLN